MYFLLKDFFDTTNGLFRLFSYTTFRCGIAMAFSFFWMFLFMPKYIRFSHKWQAEGQPIRENYLPSHSEKKGTPTMGGFMIVLTTIFSTMLFADIGNVYVLILLGSLLSFGLIGFFDDFKKIRRKDTGGIHGKTKLVFQCLIAVMAVYCANYYVGNDFYSKTLTFPFLRKLVFDIGVIYTIFRVFVIVGASNAVNLTDGLDGLAIVPIMVANCVFFVFAYIIGNAVFSKYLIFNYQVGVQEICVFISAIIGSSMGFLWYNIKPAQIFMGDTGSLSLGGSLGVVAVILKCEFLLAIVGGLFVMETISVMLQVASFKLSHGKKRIFKMAPLHHHFEKSGWSEMQVVVRFWIIAILFAFIGLASLKIR